MYNVTKDYWHGSGGIHLGLLRVSIDPGHVFVLIKINRLKKSQNPRL